LRSTDEAPFHPHGSIRKRACATWGGSIEEGKNADFVGVSGHPANDVAELDRVKF
jgi:hypothetical protein